MNNRRKFLLKTLGASLGVSFSGSYSNKLFARDSFSKDTDGGFIMCSRGEVWGEKVLEPAERVLKDNGNLLDAIEKAANVTELDPEDTSVGYGGLPDEDGIVTLDASFMDGKTHNCGSVAHLENIKTPSSVARLVMERTDHIHLVGDGALRFAKMHGFKEEDLLTDRSRKIWLRWKESLSDKDDYLPPADGNYDLERPTGTINILGMDRNRNVAGCTTTSGLFGKIRGRVGDSPIIGAGLYVDNEVGGAGATGRGEEVLRMCGSFYVIEKMRAGLNPQEACEAACKKIIDINGGPYNVDFNVKFVAHNKNGQIGVACISGHPSKPPEASFWTKNDGFNVVRGSIMIEHH